MIGPDRGQLIWANDVPLDGWIDALQRWNADAFALLILLSCLLLPYILVTEKIVLVGISHP